MLLRRQGLQTLAEMVNIGIPVPPGFTITNGCVRELPEDADDPGGCCGAGARERCARGEGDGQEVR